MANLFITEDIIAMESLRSLVNQLVATKTINTAYRNEFAKNGEAIRLRKPNRYTIRTGATFAAQDYTEASHSFAITQQAGVDWNFSSREQYTSVQDFVQRSDLKEAVAQIAQHIESAVADQYKKLYWWAGTAGTVPSTFLHLREPGELLTYGSAPLGDRHALHTPEATTKFADTLKTVFVQDISRNALQEASFGRYAGLNNYESVSLKNHTVGVATGTPLVNGATQNVAYTATSPVNVANSWTQQLVTNGWTDDITGILLEGDIITLAGVNAVNPKTRTSTGKLQTFVVRADADSGATTGPATLTISPPIITSGAYQTVDAAPADDAVIVVKGTGGTGYNMSLAYHRDCISLATFNLEMPNDVSFKARAIDMQTGISIRVLKTYDWSTDKLPVRLDVLFAVDAINPQLGCRLTH